MTNTGLHLSFILGIILVLNSISTIDGQCFAANAVTPSFYSANYLSFNLTFDSVSTCIQSCGDLRYAYAAIEDASFCLCGMSTTDLTAATTCTVMCADNQPCGGSTPGVISVYPTTSAASRSYNITFSLDKTSVPVATVVTATVNASPANFTIDWGDGSTPVENALTHSYNLPGIYTATAVLQNYPMGAGISLQVTVHDAPLATIQCPTILQLGVPLPCNVTTLRQGFEYDLTWSLTNTTTTEGITAHVPAEILEVFGKDSLGTDTLTAGSLTTGSLAVFHTFENIGGSYVFRVRTNAATAGTIGIYSITQQCSSNTYCGITNLCSATCDAGATLSCTSSTLCTPYNSCSKTTCASGVQSTSLYSFSLLTTVAIPAGAFSYDLPTPVYLPPGTMLGYGCDSAASCAGTPAVINSRPLSATNFEGYNYMLLTIANSSFSTPSSTVLITQIEVRLDPALNPNVILLCEAAAPIANAAVPTPYSATTEQYVYNGNLNFTFNLNSPTVNVPSITQLSILCQQNITSPTLIPEIWMPYGTPYPFTVSFTQGSPLFSAVTIDSTIHYDYWDNALNGHVMSLSLTYALEGLYTLTGNTSNALGYVIYQSIIHVVPLITNTWTLTIVCPCLDITLGFPFNLDFPTAAHPPWNATFKATYELGTLFPQEVIDFGTFGSGGAAAAIPISKTAVVLTAGTYTATVTLQNEVSNTTITQTFTVAESIRDVTAFLQWNDSGIIMDGMGANEVIFMTNFTTFIYPSCRTGVPDKWRLIINETGVVLTTFNVTENFTLIFAKDSIYTLTVSAYNSVQGWVDSPPIVIQTVSNIQGFVLTDDGIITPPGANRNLKGLFDIFTPLSCIVINFGDGSESETYGLQTLCDKSYPSAMYMGTQIVAPIVMPHVYQTMGVYDVIAIAFDQNVTLTQTLSVVVGNFPCTMPVVTIINSTKVTNSIPSYQKSSPRFLTSIATFQCNVTANVTRWWTITQIDPITLAPITDIVVNPVLSSWNSSQLTIPASYLPYGTHLITYYLSIYINANISLERTDYTYLTIVPSPLQPVIMAGYLSEVKCGYGQILLFDPGSLSVDPDFPNDKTNVTYQWWCQQLAPSPGIPLQLGLDNRWITTNVQAWPTPALLENRTGGGCFGIENGAMSTGPQKVYFNTANFINPEATYQFILQMNRDNRSSFTTIKIQSVITPPPAIQITCPPGMCFVSGDSLIINPTVRLALNGNCTSGCTSDMKYYWTILTETGNPVNEASQNCGSTAVGEATVISTAPSNCTPTFTSGMNSSSIAIEPVFFVNNPGFQSYYLKLTGITNDGNEGFSAIIVKENQPPTSGSCILSNLMGDALLSVYPAVCSNWIDPEYLGIQSYTFYYFKTTPTGIVRNTLASSGQPSLNLIMPVGNFCIYVDITDVLQAYTTYELGNITVVMPNETAINNYDPSKTIAYLTSIGDQTSLGMVLIALASVRDNANWLSLDPTALANLTQDEIMARIAAITNMNNDELKNALANMDFATLGQLNVGGGILQSALAGVFGSALGPFTVDMSTRANALALLQTMANQIPTINVPDPHQLEPFLSNAIDSAASLIKGINVVLSQDVMVPPTDLAAATDLDYNTDITGIDMTIPTDQNTMMTHNVLDTTKSQAQAQIAQIFSIINQISGSCYAKMVDGETVKANSPNGASIIISKINEGILVNGLTISAGNNTQAQVKFPKNFCPSHYVLNHTNCRQELGLLATIWPTITHIFPDSSSLLSNTTKVLDITVNISGSQVNVKNETLPIILDIPRDIESLPSSVYVKASDYNGKTIIYHYFNVSNTESAYTIEITPFGTLPQNMILLIDHERMPTPSQYLKIVKINTLPVNKNGTYTLFVSSDENANRSGRFFGGIAILNQGLSLTSNVTLTANSFQTSFPVDYSFRVFLSGCYYFDSYAVAWGGTGVNVVQATPYLTTCAAYHLTPFGSGFLPEPNLLDFDYVFAHAGFLDNSTLYAVLIVVTIWYIIMMIWAHFMDKKDIQKRGVIPLPDNKVHDKYLYEVSFTTGPDKEASTDSQIYFIASGDYGESEVRLLPPATNNLYRRFAVNTFIMSVPKPLGHINFLRVFHDNTGEPPLDSWQLQMVVFRDLQTKEKSIFDVNSWLAFDRDEGKIDKIYLSMEEDEKTFSQNMYVRSNQAANRDHIWMGMFLRPPGSRFVRKERVSVCAVFLYLSMLMSALWYNRSTDSSRNGYFDYGSFTLSSDQLITGACVLLIVYPFVYALCLVFKRARPKNLKRCRALDSIEKQRETQLLAAGVPSDEAVLNSKIEVDENRSSKIKQKSPIRCIPWWTRVIAWALILVCIAGSIFLVWSYGIMWGEIKTVKWFSSFILAFFISILVVQWLEVIIHSMVTSSLCKTDLSSEDADCDEELPALKQNEEWTHVKFVDQGLRKKVHKVEGVDIENSDIAALRTRLMKERESTSAVKGILAYCGFLAVIYVIMNGRTNYNTFLLQDHLRSNIIKEKNLFWDYSQTVQTTGDWWNWANNVILQELRAQRAYNKAPPYGLRGFMNDRANRMLGYAIIRQIRNRRYNCAAPSPLDQIIHHCSGVRGIVNEDSRDYCAGWTLNETFHGSCQWKEYQYLTASQIQTYSTTGKLGYYTGGGYVLQLSGNQNALLQRMTKLQENHWVDGNTRALILEWAVYNANINLFSICSVMAEFTEGGGILPSWRFQPLQLISDTGINGYVTEIAEILFAIIIIFFTLKELWQLKKLKLDYFRNNWNLAEICILLISYTAIGLYFYRSILTQTALDVFNATNGNGYVRIDTAANVDQYFLYCIGAIVFFSTLKLIKLLQFNKKMNVLALTIKKCWDELKIFLIAFAIIFFGFTCIFFFMFTANVQDFAEIVSSVLCSFKMMLGKFDFKEMNAVNPYSPILFFIFSLVNSMILINIMLTIILFSFNEVKKELENVDNRLNVIDFVWLSFRQFMRKENLKKISVEPKFSDRRDTDRFSSLPKERDSDLLPDKVSQLLKYINEFYFDGKLDLNDPEAKKALMAASFPEKTKPTFRDPQKIGKRNVLQSDT